MSSQEWSRTVRVDFDEDVNAVARAKAEATLTAAFAKFLEEIEEYEPEVVTGHAGRSSAEPRAPSGTNGAPSGNGRRKRGPNRPKMQVPVHPLTGALSVENDE